VTEDDNRDQEARYEAARALNERAFQAKERMRKRLAALSFTEKIKILEKLRDRELAIAAAGLRWTPGRESDCGKGTPK
jgi:hypothetical protein